MIGELWGMEAARGRADDTLWPPGEEGWGGGALCDVPGNDAEGKLYSPW